MAKIQISIRLPERAIRLLRDVAHKLEWSQSRVVEEAINKTAKREGIK